MPDPSRNEPAARAAVDGGPSHGGPRHLVARLEPHCGDGEPDPTSITCADVTDCRRLRSIVAELATVNADLRSIHTELRCTQHELLVTNNELRFVYDELLTAHAHLLRVKERLRIQENEQAHNKALVEAALDRLGERRHRGRNPHHHPNPAQQTRS